MENLLNQLLCGFRKVHSTKYAFFRLLQKWQKELDSRGIGEGGEGYWYNFNGLIESL